MKRVVVTGLGAVTPLGKDVESTWRGLVAGRSGVNFVTSFDTSSFPNAIAAEVRDFRTEEYMPARSARRMDRSSQFGIVAALEALRDAGLESQSPLGPSAGVVFGSSIGGYHVLEAQNALLDESGPRRITPFALTGFLTDSS
jgi:3-oxoacyl-[acyl-carrier-protein] synthase II